MRPELLADAIGNVLNEVLSEIRVRLDAFDARLTGLETRSASVTYRGVYESETEYRPGELCTRSGSLWLCVKGTRGAPGSDAVGWLLVVKQGKG